MYNSEAPNQCITVLLRKIYYKKLYCDQDYQSLAFALRLSWNHPIIPSSFSA